MRRVGLSRLWVAMAGTVALALTACGGGSSSTAGTSNNSTGGSSNNSSAPAPAPGASAPVKTTKVTTRVVDGAISNALVCLDKNGNGKCDADEPQARTDLSGNVTLDVPDTDLGKYPLVALVGTDAVDADHGPVTVAYAMSTPADNTAVVTPLTTLVQQTVASSGATTAEAAKSVQNATGITSSPLQDFSKAGAPTDGSINPATVARMVVLTTQAQTSAVASTVGTPSSDGQTISRGDVDKLVQQKVLDLLPSVVSSATDTSVTSAITPQDKEAALALAAKQLITNSGISASSVPIVVAANNQVTSGTAPSAMPEASGSLRELVYSSAKSFFFREFTSSVAQATPDSDNNYKYVERRVRAVAGKVTKWGAGSDPWRGADLHWNGSAWVNCPVNFESIHSVRDAGGNSTYNYCDGRETGKGTLASFDVSGRDMSAVYAEIRAAGYTNLTINDPTTSLGSATFPAGSKVLYQSSTALNTAYAYYPGGGDPAGTGNVVTQYSPTVSAGGVATSQAAGVACNSTEANGNGTNTATLEQMIALATGTPCSYAPSNFTYNNVLYYSGEKNEWWGNSTLAIGTIGNALIGAGPAPGFYSGNVKVRVAFKGATANAVTFYACQERFNNGSTRNCTVIGFGTYSIETLGDARVLTLSNAPAQAAALSYNRIFVERGGVIYLGYKNKTGVFNSARFNLTGTNALLTQLGITPEDPSVPVALNALAYQGTWDVKDSTQATVAKGITVIYSIAGDSTCQRRLTAAYVSCTLTISDPATGAFTLTMTDGTTASGTLDYLAGTGTGTYHDPTVTPTDGTFVAKRR